jgi:hypothetical protein
MFPYRYLDHLVIVHAETHTGAVVYWQNHLGLVGFCVSVVIQREYNCNTFIWLKITSKRTLKRQGMRTTGFIWLRIILNWTLKRRREDWDWIHLAQDNIKLNLRQSVRVWTGFIWLNFIELNSKETA